MAICAAGAFFVAVGGEPGLVASRQQVICGGTPTVAPVGVAADVRPRAALSKSWARQRAKADRLRPRDEARMIVPTAEEPSKAVSGNRAREPSKRLCSPGRLPRIRRASSTPIDDGQSISDLAMLGTASLCLLGGCSDPCGPVSLNPATITLGGASLNLVPGSRSTCGARPNTTSPGTSEPVDHADRRLCRVQRAITERGFLTPAVCSTILQ